MSGISAANDFIITIGGALGTFTITGAISPEWAVPVNTLLLIVLGIVNRGIVKSVREVQAEAVVLKDDAVTQQQETQNIKDKM